ncbi:hypothetical protein PPH94_034240 [Burkholderia cepacia]|uniref:hypothetical protein n=1 Tax=Burkholderia cepacia TaxID=292 RepID=UPI00234AB6A4|nr:hypothetical protein [Burkholderia cepacia]MDC6098515.1 hypothetical protein [Burkholderia cepacia]
MPPNSDTDTLKPITSACVLAIRGDNTRSRRPAVSGEIDRADRLASCDVHDHDIAFRRDPPVVEKKPSRSVHGIDEKKRAAARHARKLGDR